MALKIAPDLDSSQLRQIAEAAVNARFDALIATNTTISRPADLRSPHRHETGGLSGAPLRPLATRAVAELHAVLQGRLPVIGGGGVASAADVQEKLSAGADLVQLYTGFIYRGPSIVRNILAALEHC